MFKKIFKKRRNKKVVLKKDDHVRHDWVMALFALFIVTVLIVLLSGLIFVKTSAIQEPDVEIPQSASLIDEELLGESLEFYKIKEDRYSEYQNKAPLAPKL